MDYHSNAFIPLAVAGCGLGLARQGSLGRFPRNTGGRSVTRYCRTDQTSCSRQQLGRLTANDKALHSDGCDWFALARSLGITLRF